MFKIGDRVRIKLDLEANKAYNGCMFTPKMEVNKGKIGIITYVSCKDYQLCRYKLDIDSIYYFSNDMLEPINDSNSIFSYKIGDMVRIIDEIPKDLCGISVSMWLRLLRKFGKIRQADANADSYYIFIPELSVSFWFSSKHFKKESTLTSENSIENVSKLIECAPEIELSYCEKQIYTI